MKDFVVEVCYWLLKFVYVIFGLAIEKKSVLVRLIYWPNYTLISPLSLPFQSALAVVVVKMTSRTMRVLNKKSKWYYCVVCRERLCTYIWCKSS